ncbi:hypothetical protein CJ20_197 [Escherichia phage CJ20]|nr:hypothetical protein CJ20_197 [Escherichia phage CJ20]
MAETLVIGKTLNVINLVLVKFRDVKREKVAFVTNCYMVSQVNAVQVIDIVNHSFDCFTNFYFFIQLGLVEKFIESFHKKPYL